jgi:aminopeptidase N
MSRKILLPAFVALMSLVACKPQGKITEVRNLPEMEITADRADTSRSKAFARPIYNPTYLRRNDLIHTKLDVRFDWNKQHLIGKAWLKLRPVFYSVDSLRLDAKGFDIKKVALMNGTAETPLQYSYTDGKNLRIKLDKTYTREQEYNIYIEYVAKPEEMPTGGSEAITSDKGLYFINPLGEDPKKPKQIWTQGETEASSKWFPTIDRPNERCTQEISITVENKYRTLSNGLLKTSTPNADGTRTDYWVMDKGHTPYLFMMAVGEFSTVKDKWEDIELEYIVEQKYEADAKAIFPHTPEMLTFFSKKLGVRYPWQKYSQIIVRDYVSGAMENTTAVIFGDFVQRTSRQIADMPELNENIVAHEMMHHWFGDLVTCESWSNLPLNESFANYSEYLWQEYKHGREAADHHRTGEVTGYLRQSVMQNSNHPLIYFSYKDKEDMFDSHSYNKGGTILHMLRQYVGDDAFFESLRLYLTTHQYQSAEVHDLRLAFEKVTGEDLNWFFNQWFFVPRHPELDIERKYNEATKTVDVIVKQTQDIEKSTVFILPFYIDIYTDLNAPAQRHQVRMTEQNQTFSFVVSKKPVWVAVDATRDLLCERRENQDPEEWIAQYKLGKTFHDRQIAIGKLKDLQSRNKEAAATLLSALNDPYWGIRESAIDGLTFTSKDADICAKVEKIAKTDPRNSTRAAAIEQLVKVKANNALAVCKNAIDNDQSYLAMASGLNGMADLDNKAALEYALRLEKEKITSLLTTIARIYIKAGDKKYCPFFEENWQYTENYATYTFLDNYASLLIKIDDISFATSKIEFFKNIAVGSNNDEWSRYGGAFALKKMRDYLRDSKDGNAGYLKTNEAIEEIKQKEKSVNLQNIYAKW